MKSGALQKLHKLVCWYSGKIYIWNMVRPWIQPMEVKVKVIWDKLFLGIYFTGRKRKKKNLECINPSDVSATGTIFVVMIQRHTPSSNLSPITIYFSQKIYENFYKIITLWRNISHKRSISFRFKMNKLFPVMCW